MAKKKKGTATVPVFPDDSNHPGLARDDYAKRLQPLQYSMRALSLAYFQQHLNGIVVIEGSDTAGKGGAIRRMTAELDPRHYEVWPIGPPTEEELRHHYMRRFWQVLPERGLIGIFDRSWYGRVLVERVDALTPEANWRRAYDEIRAFEQTLINGGTRLVKIYLHVTADEQKRRLAERVKEPHKRWKVSAADFRSHLQRDEYMSAAEEMFEHTSTEAAPWHVIAADNKRHTRVKVIETVFDAFAKDIDLAPLPLDEDTLRLAADVLGNQE